MENEITPNKWRTSTKFIREALATLHKEAQEIRDLKAALARGERPRLSGKGYTYLATDEDVEGMLVIWGTDARHVRRLISKRNGSTVVKGIAYSLTAANRVCGGHTRVR